MGVSNFLTLFFEKMKKLILALAAVALTAGFSVKADDNSVNCPVNQQCVAAGRHCNAPCDSAACQTACQTACKAACPFADLNLTDAQKQQLRDLWGEQCKARKENSKQARREARNECRRNGLAKIKGILTAEQYVKFLENSYVNGGKPQPRHLHHGMQPRPRKELQNAKAVRAAKRADNAKLRVVEKK